MLPHLVAHGLGVAICFVGVLISLYGLTGQRALRPGPRSLGIVGIIVLVVGGVVALGPMIV